MKKEKKEKRIARRESEADSSPGTRSAATYTGGSRGIDWKALLTDWRVALVIVLVLASVIAIYPHPENGKIETNLQYGLDLNEGAWLQLELQAEVVTFETTAKVSDFVQALSKDLDTDVELVGPNQVEIRKALTEDEVREA
ncbi:MAG TPA: preprotein translocase subunit SecD, partial [Methanoregulaceae archaeon]|nr:preprotein translocase subunit SecD [Methanoregulaceae archaeon]